MRLLLILFLKLYIFRLGYCDDACFNEPDTIYLLKTNDNRHNQVNDLFKRRVYKILDAEVRSIDVDGISLVDALDSIPAEAVAIHLHVTDFYQHNYTEIQQHNFRYAGNIENINNQSSECFMLITDNTLQLNETNVNKTEMEKRCEIRFETQTKLVSKSMDNYPRLLDFVTSFNPDDPNINHYDDAEKMCQPMVVVICRDHRHAGYPYSFDGNTIRYIMKRKIRIDTINSCQKYNYHKTDRMIAVFAPKPFVLKEKLNTLTIFYDELETDQTDDIPETRDMFGNGFSLVESKGKMNSVFLKIMQMMEWKRVAIISDDSPFSQTFEQELTSLFDKENVIYTSKSCVDPNCDYIEALSPIMTAEPRIVIVNVLEANADRFVSQASRWSRSIVWLVRDWSPNAVNNAASKLGDVISITLGVAPPKNSIHYDLQCRHEPCNFKKLLSILDDIDTNTNLNSHRLKSPLDWRVKRYLEYKLLEVNNVIAYATWYRQNYDRQINTIATASIRLSRLENEYSWHPATPQTLSELSDCTFKSDVYLHPCNDIEYMLIMLVISVFSLTILGVIYFFQTSEGPYSRMAR